MKINYNFLKMSALIIAGALFASSLSVELVFAEDDEEDNFATAENILEVDPLYVGDTLEPEQEPIVDLEGTVTDDEAVCEFLYTAPRDGNFYIEISDIKANCYVTIEIVDSLNNQIYIRHSCKSDSTHIDFEEGESYTIRIKQSSGNTGFTVHIYVPREAIDVTDYGIVNDNITYDGQLNTYLYTAPRDGRYLFELDDKTANIDYSFSITDPYGKNIYDFYSPWVDFEEGATYQIKVGYSNGLGKYLLKLYDAQKQTEDISGYTDIKDNFEFTEQTNYYTFTAPVSGNYSFEFDSAALDRCYFTIVDSGNTNIFSSAGYNLSGEVANVYLNAGEEYLIMIEKQYLYDGYGSYDFYVGYPSSAQEYLDNFSMAIVDDSSDNEIDSESKEDLIASEEADTSQENLILQELEALQSEIDDLKDENEMLKNALEENEIEYD